MAILPSLKQTLTVYFLLVAAIPVLLFGLVGLELIADYQLKDIHARNMKSAQSVAGEVSSFLLEVQSDLHQIEETINSRSIIQPGGENDYLGIAIRNSRFLESIYLLDADRRIRHLGVMPQLHARRGDYMQLDFSSHQIFQNDPMFTNPAWSDTFVSLVTGEPAVTLGLPIRHGALLGNIRLVSLSRLLQRYSTREELAFAIIDSTGALIAHSDNDLALLRMNFNTHPVVASALSGTELTGEHRHDSATYLESVARVEPAGWVVWASLNLEAVQAPIRSLRNLLVGFMLLAFLLAGIIAVINVRRLMLPLNALGSRARKIADGDYAFRFRPSGFEEIDTLADQFAKMSEAIQVREESIVSSEKKFRNLVNSIDGIVWEMDYPSSRFLFVSKQSESILGYPPGDWLAHENFWKEIAHPDDVEPSFTYCRMMSEKHEDHSFEFRGIAADGRTVWIRNLISVMVEAGRPVRLLGVMIDISQQMELLENLERSERNYREIFNATSEAIFIHDKETGEILDVNQAMLDVYGCEYAEALQLTIADLSLNQPPYTLSEAMGRLKMAAERGDCVYEWRSRRRNGDLFWAEVALKRAMIAGQERVISVVRDISERKEAERQLETYRGHLETL
ncbi:MAG: PAS domain S-box protein, partial [Desulfuromonadales bacterium]|nr:PAS domain S-box protein [Desulfuromonadales bacterium]